MKYVNRFRWILFASNFCVNIDLGILPACTIKMSKDLDLDTSEFGGLGSVVYIGQAIGCIIVGFCFQYVDEFKAIPFGLTLNMLSLLFFTFLDDYWAMMICRGLTGLF